MPADESLREGEPRDTRQRILQVSLDHFSTRGYGATSMRQIARDVGVRESAIYAHFKSKQDILDTLFTHFGPGAAAERLARLDPAELVCEPQRVLRAFVQSGVEQWTRPEAIKLFRIGMLEHITCGTKALPAPQRAVADVVRRLNELFTLLVREKVLVDLDPSFLLAEFIGPMFYMRQECTLFTCTPESLRRLTSFCLMHVDHFLDKTLRNKETT